MTYNYDCRVAASLSSLHDLKKGWVEKIAEGVADAIGSDAHFRDRNKLEFELYEVERGAMVSINAEAWNGHVSLDMTGPQVEVEISVEPGRKRDYGDDDDLSGLLVPSRGATKKLSFRDHVSPRSIMADVAKAFTRMATS